VTVPVAATPLSRLLGLALLDREAAGPGLLIPRCRSVHTLGMRFPLHVVFLDRRSRVVKTRPAVPPGRLLFCPGAAYVLELPYEGIDPMGHTRHVDHLYRRQLHSRRPGRPSSWAGESLGCPSLKGNVLPDVERLATVVVCEDDELTRELLCDQLTADRYRTLPAPSASDALRLCGYNQPDLMILDLGLPDAPGIDVLRELRGADGATARLDPELPVLILSGFGSEADRVRAFAAGADDFVVKPFHYPELVARVGAVLRRRSQRRQGTIRIGELVIDPVVRKVTVRGREVALANKEFTLLRTLAAEPRRVFTKQELLRDVWGYRSMGRTRTLDSHASRLRRKLDPEGSRFVFNCWGVGYRLIEG
jgi:DNA-binding response OmpR family regulator/uncharacterized membrane protein (UPF0127 family)